MGRAGYTKNMLIGSAIAAVLLSASRLYLSENARRWVGIAALIVFAIGITLPRLALAIKRRREAKRQ
jgi:uncharacterized membrane protein YhaH (DUF805 family)